MLHFWGLPSGLLRMYKKTEEGGKTERPLASSPTRALSSCGRFRASALCFYIPVGFRLSGVLPICWNPGARCTSSSSGVLLPASRLFCFPAYFHPPCPGRFLRRNACPCSFSCVFSFRFPFFAFFLLLAFYLPRISLFISFLLYKSPTDGSEIPGGESSALLCFQEMVPVRAFSAARLQMFQY